MRTMPKVINKASVTNGVKYGEGVVICLPSNFYHCQIDDNVFIGPFVEIQEGAVVGAETRIQSHTFICTGVTIGKKCFISHGVVFINDKRPVVNNPDWKAAHTIIEDGVNIGSNATILPVRIGKGATIGAGAVVTKDVPAGATVVGNPGRVV